MVKFAFIFSFLVLLQFQLLGQSYADVKSAYKGGDYVQAISLAEKVLATDPDKGTEAQVTLLLGQSEIETKDYSKAIDHLSSAKDQLKDLGSDEGEAIASIYLGEAYAKSKKDSKAIDSYKFAFEYFKKSGDNKEVSNLCGDIGNTYYHKKDLKKAIEWFEKGHEYALKDNDKKSAARHLLSAGSLYSNYGDYSKAKTTLNQALKLAEEINNSGLINSIEKNILTVEQNIANKENATSSYDEEVDAQEDAIMSDLKHQNFKSLEEIEMLSEEMQLAELKIKAQQDEYEKKLLEEQLSKLEIQKDLELSKANEEKTAAVLEQERIKSEKQKLILLGSIAIGVLLLIFAVVLFIGYKNKQKTNTQLIEQNTIISNQKDEIKAQATEINESIEYAKQIHISILPKIVGFQEKYKSFVYINPKDIVSGDIFWHKTSGGYTYVAVADCTGHGVPGAFTSIIASGALDEVLIAKPMANPSEILELVDKAFKTKFEKNNEIKVGMDVAIIRIDPIRKSLIFAGARNAFYLVRNNELMEYKATRRSVSPNEHKTNPFKDNEIPYQEKDEIFLFSDGFPDQKGGLKNEKFFYQSFRDLLVACASLPLEQQEEFISNNFNDWKNNQEQYDDVTVVGLIL